MEIPGLPPRLLGALVAQAEGRRLAVVGGAVRDLLLHRVHDDPWRGLPDLDLVVEGSAPQLAERLQRWAGPERVAFCRPHPAYGTVELELDGVLLDLASARRETYPALGENPQVRFASLEDDLARRDFTINAMALELASGDGGVVALRVLDPHQGQADLERRLLRFLHGSSVAEDPTCHCSWLALPFSTVTAALLAVVRLLPMRNTKAACGSFPASSVNVPVSWALLAKV